MYVLDNCTSELNLFFTSHNFILAEYFVKTQTLDIIISNCHLPDIYIFIKKYVSLCNIHYPSKISYYKKYWEVGSFFVSDKAWFDITIDLIKSLLTSKKQHQNSVWLTIYWIIKMAHFILYHNIFTNIKLANFFLRRLFIIIDFLI